MPRFFTRCLLTFALVCASACSSEPSESKDTNSEIQLTTQEQPKAQTQGITIGAFLHGSAPDEAAAKAFEQGMDLAADATTPAKIKRIVLDRSKGAADSSSLPALLASAPLIVYWQTADVAPVAPILKQANVIGVPVWNVTRKVAALGTNIFGFGYSTERSFAGFAKFAGNKLKSYRFGILSSSAEPFDTQSKEFIEETKSLGNTVVFEEKVDSAEADFKGLVARAKNEKCDTIFAVLPGNALISLIKAARENSFSGKILVGDSFFESERAVLGKDAEGVYILQAWSDDATFKSKYTAKYGNEPDGITLGAAALGYDLIQCIETVGAITDSESIAHAWLSTPCEGLTGKTQFSGERIAQRQKRILTVKGDKFELAG